MQALTVIEEAAAAALDVDEPAALHAFRAVVDPGSVMEMAMLIRTMLDWLEDGDTALMNRDELVAYVKKMAHLEYPKL